MNEITVGLINALLDAAAENTTLAREAAARTDIPPENAALTAKCYASAALSQIQAHVTLTGRGRR